MTLSRLLFVHALLTLAAGLVLIGAPGVIPGFVGIPVVQETNLLCYLVGVDEVSLAVLSYCSRRLSDQQALKLVCLTLVSFHLLTAGVEVYAFTLGVSARIWANVVLRVIVTALFS